MNQAIFVGRIVTEPIVELTEDETAVSKITVAVPRPYKNKEGVYETDFIDCTLWDSVAQRTAEYCKKGDIVGIKGRIQSNLVDKEGEKKKFMNIVAEKVTFLSSRQNVQEKSDKDLEEEIEK